MHTQTSSFSTDSLCTKQMVGQLLHMSERSIERLVSTRRFPRPVRLGKQTYWAREVVQKWLDQRFEQQMSWEPRKK